MQAQHRAAKLQRSQCILFAGYVCAATIVALLAATLLHAPVALLAAICVAGFGTAITSAFVGDLVGK